jgi:hypothetical protein
VVWPLIGVLSNGAGLKVTKNTRKGSKIPRLNFFEINRTAVAYYNRGAVHSKLGNHNRAIDDFKTAAKLNDEDAKDLLKSQGINW